MWPCRMALHHSCIEAGCRLQGVALPSGVPTTNQKPGKSFDVQPEAPSDIEVYAVRPIRCAPSLLDEFRSPPTRYAPRLSPPAPQGGA
jgi:hypothetical protein